MWCGVVFVLVFWGCWLVCLFGVLVLMCLSFEYWVSVCVLCMLGREWRMYGG